MKDLGVVFLAGHNEGTKEMGKEYLEKRVYSFLYSFFSDSLIFGKNKALLKISYDRTDYKKLNIFKLLISLYKDFWNIKRGKLDDSQAREYKMDGRPYVANKVVEANLESKYVNEKYAVCVGPKHSLEQVLNRRVHTVAQGKNIQTNVGLGTDALFNGLGYKGEYFLVCCCDLSAITDNTIDTTIENFRKRRDNETKIYAGVGTWESLPPLIEKHNLEKYGRMGSKFFPFIPGRINKYGLTVVDDAGVVNDSEQKYKFLWGNMFIVHKSMKDHPDVAGYIYSIKRAALNPMTLLSFIKFSGVAGLYRLLINKTYRLTEAEKFTSWLITKRFPGVPDFKCKTMYTPPEAVLDIDTWKDHYRNSALIMKR